MAGLRSIQGLDERELLALAIALEEEDARMYGDFAVQPLGTATIPPRQPPPPSTSFKLSAFSSIHRRSPARFSRSRQTACWRSSPAS